MFSTLLIGDWGEGKTTAASTAPKPIVYIDFDNKLHKMVNLQELLKSGEIIQWPVDTQLSMLGLRRLATEENKHGKENVTQQRPKGYLMFVDYMDTLEKTKCTLSDGRKIGTIRSEEHTSELQS